MRRGQAMEERIPQPREARGPTVAEPACDDGDAPPVVQLLSPSSGEESSDDEAELEFEFPFVSRDSPAGTAAPADELFADGRIRAFYPVFGRGAGCTSSSSHGGCTARAAAPAVPPRVRGQLGKLFLEETRQSNSSASSSASTSSSSSSGAVTDDDGLEGAAPESYCVWRPGSSASPSPSPSPPPRKSGSTGSMARWRRISDLVVGRSHSDGREKFLFLAAAPPAHDAPRRHKKPAPAPARKPPPSAAVAAADADTAAHRIAYLARGGLDRGGVPVPPGGTPRRTFLPYREELVGFFANVNGISRSHHHPF